VIVDVESGAIRSQRPVRLGARFISELLPYFDQYALSHRLWAPDSSSILLPLIGDDGVTRLVSIRPDGSDGPPAIEGDAGFWSP
jgi:hypothetical protein